MLAIGDQIGLTLDRVVLATDFSPASEKASGYAQGLARHFSSSLSVAEVIDLTELSPCADVMVGVAMQQVRDTNEEEQQKTILEMTMAGVRASAYTMESHDPAASVVQLANNLRADLIVAGTNARHGLEKAIIGSCAEGIIQQAKCPVLTVGPEARPVPKGPLSFDRILFATDFSPEAAKQAALAFGFARESIAKIYLCHVVEKYVKDPDEWLDLEQSFEKSLSKLIPPWTYDFCEPQCLVESGSVAPRILELASRVQADLIVLGAARSEPWFHRFIEGTVQKVLAHATCPVMTLHGA
jgi:nucleotide-binding universal stress UspA family protein